jgi:hypothetical protein
LLDTGAGPSGFNNLICTLEIDSRKFAHAYPVRLAYQPAVLFSHNKPATSNQPAVLFSQNKPAPAISHQPNEQAINIAST